MSKKVKTLVVPASFSDKGLFPLTGAVPRELLPLGGVTIMDYIVERAVESGAEEVVFITPQNKKMILDHFLRLKDESEMYSDVSFSHILQKKESGGARTASRAEKSTEGEPFMLSFNDFVLRSRTPVFSQLASVFRTTEKPVIALSRESSHIVETEKIANRLYKVRGVKIREDGDKESLGISGKSIMTNASLEYFKSSSEDEEVADAVGRMVSSGKTVYAYEVEGEWMPVYDHDSYLKSIASFL